MIPEIEYMTCYLDGRLGRAKEILRKLIAEHPDYAAFHADLALVYLQQGEIAEAREAAEKARALVASSKDTTPPGDALAGSALSSDVLSSNAPARSPGPARPGILAAVGFVRERIGDHEGALSLYEEAKSATSSMGRRRLWIDNAIKRVRKRLSGHEGLEEDKEGQNDPGPRHVQAQLRISYFLDPNLGPDALRLVYEHMNRLMGRGHKVYAIARTDKLDEVSAEIIRVPAREELYERVPDSDIVVATSWRTAFDAARVPGAAPFYLVQPSPHLEPKGGLAEGSGAESADQASKNLEASFRLPLRLIASSDYVRSVLKARYNRRADVVPYGVDLDTTPTPSPSPGPSPNPNIQATYEIQGAKDRPTRLLVVGSDEDEWMENIYAALRLILERRQGDVEVVRVSPSRRLDFSFHVATWVENPDSSQLARIFSDCDVFITGSPEGIFSQGALTAMAYGLPVVLCAREEGISSYMGREIASHKEEIASHTDGEERARISNLATGHDIAEGYTESVPYLLVLLNDAEAIARAIETLIDDEDLRKKVGSNGQEIVKAHTWDRAIDQLEGLLLAAVTDVQLAYPSAAALGVTPATGRGMGGDRVTFESSPHESVSQASRLSPRRRPTLSLCMIVKNEERFLARCLDSVKDVVDEMIIVDTGSTDRTVEIAKSYGAKVYFHEWKNDFAEARNASLEKATGDWILVMDADEVLEAESTEVIRDIVRNGKRAIYAARIKNVLGESRDSAAAEHYMNRLFPNDASLRFRGSIHEKIDRVSGESILPVPVRDLRIRHDGYRQEVFAGRQKLERNISILEEFVRNNPDDYYRHYSLGGMYNNSGQLRKALEHLFQAYSIATEHIEKPMAKGVAISSLFLLGTIHASLKKVEESEQLLNAALELSPTNPNVLHSLAALKASNKDWEEACRLYMLAVDGRRSKSYISLSDDPGAGGWKSWLGVAECKVNMDDFKGALEALRRCVMEVPDRGNMVGTCRYIAACLSERKYDSLDRNNDIYKPLLGQWVQGFLASVEPGEGKATVNPPLDDASIDKLMETADNAARRGDLSIAIDCYSRVLRSGVRDTQFLLKFAHTLSLAGNVRDAFKVYLEIAKREPTNLEVIDRLIKINEQMRLKVSR